MRVLIIGKKNFIRFSEAVTENMSKYAAVSFFCVNPKKVGYVWSKCRGEKYRDIYLRRLLRKRIHTFKPDAVLFISGFFLPQSLFDEVAMYPNLKKASWCADAFKDKEQKKIDCLDIVFCSDTGFIPIIERLGGHAIYMPLCVDENLFTHKKKKKTLPPFFVGMNNPKRTEYLSAVRQKCLIYGRRWDKSKLPQHDVRNKRIRQEHQFKFVQSSIAPLNLAFSTNNINGLNFRPFEISACGGLIINNACPDIELCYEVGKEALVYHSPEEFADLIDDVVAHPEKYKKIAESGYERTIRDHTYAKRCTAILNAFEKLPKRNIDFL